MTDFQDMVTALMDRLYAAERVCVMFGATGAHHDTPRDKALHEIWSEWSQKYRHLAPAMPSDTEVAELAAKRDATRAATLQRIRTGG